MLILAFLMGGIILFLALSPTRWLDQLFGAPYITLSTEVPRGNFDGLLVQLTSAQPKPLGVQVTNSVAQRNAEYWQPALAALPADIVPLSRLYHIQSDRPLNDPHELTLTITPDATPINSTLWDVYAFTASHWDFVPATLGDNAVSLTVNVEQLPVTLVVVRTVRSVPVISLTIEAGQLVTPDMLSVATNIQPAGLQPQADGSLLGALPEGVEPTDGRAVLPLIRTDAVNSQWLPTLLSNPEQRAIHIEHLVDFATSQPYAGLVIDYAGLPSSARQSFTQFVQTLAQRLHDQQRSLGLILPFPTSTVTGFDSGAYDWTALQKQADVLQLHLPLSPTAYVKNGVVDSALTWAIRQINRRKLQLEIPCGAYAETSQGFITVPYHESVAQLGQVVLKSNPVIEPNQRVEVTLNWREPIAFAESADMAALRLQGTEESPPRTLWLMTPAAYQQRLLRTVRFNLAGVLSPDLAMLGVAPHALDGLRTYQQNYHRDNPAVVTQPAGLSWTVLSGATPIAVMTGQPNASLVYAPDPRLVWFSVQADISGAQVPIGTVIIHIATLVPPTPTPTLTPIP